MADYRIINVPSGFDITSVTEKHIIPIALTRNKVLHVPIVEEHVLAAAPMVRALAAGEIETGGVRHHGEIHPTAMSYSTVFTADDTA